jgi:hypothetical protein
MNTRIKSGAIYALALSCPILASSIAFGQAVIYVDGDNGIADPPNFGQDGWGELAHNSLQNALSDAADLLTQPEPPDRVHIWVAKGEYSPGSGVSDSFVIPDRVSVFGGFAGDEEEFAERDISPVGTILTGNWISDFCGIVTPNSIVVTIADTGGQTRLDSVTVIGGAVAGVRLNNSDAVLSNCIIERNQTGVVLDAIGAFEEITSTPRLINMRFISQSQSALRVNKGVRATVVNSIFRNNEASQGAGVAVFGGDGFDLTPAEAVLNCTIVSNRAFSQGGGIYRIGLGTT